MTDLPCTDTMKIDPSVLRKLRDERSWTQEHLAGVSGVSLRTIQRIEREGSASADTRLALAAAFGVDVALFASKSEGPAARAHHPDPAAESAASSGLRRSFLRHAFVYVAVCSFLVYRDWSASGTLTWAQWPLLGWGFGLAMHGWRTVVGGRHGSTRRDDPSLPARPRNAHGEKIAVYLVTSVFFVVLDYATTGRLTWCFYPILGWGAGLFLFGQGRKSTARSS